VREVLPPPTDEQAPVLAASQPLTVHDVFARAASGVVQVIATSGDSQHALGSGFVIDKAGHIVTSLHVVQDAQKVQVSFSNDERLAADVVGRDPATDVAVLQLKVRSRALTPLQLGSSESVRVGDPVVAIGNPLGEARSITSGIVSSLERRILAPDGAAIDDVIRTDAALDRGSFGGPLLNARAQVIGVNSQSRSVGIGFAIPIDVVTNVAAQLISKGVAQHPFVGIGARAITPTVATLFRLPVKQGLLVGGVCKSSGAARAGVRSATQHVTLAGSTWPLGGDIVVKADGMRVGSLDRLRAIVAGRQPGDTIDLELYRNDKSLDVKVKLGRQPRSPRC
jgi:S1-C subfamily serine protease